jgi:hypothetical protein
MPVEDRTRCRVPQMAQSLKTIDVANARRRDINHDLNDAISGEIGFFPEPSMDGTSIPVVRMTGRGKSIIIGCAVAVIAEVRAHVVIRSSGQGRGTIIGQGCKGLPTRMRNIWPCYYFGLADFLEVKRSMIGSIQLLFNKSGAIVCASI